MSPRCRRHWCLELRWVFVLPPEAVITRWSTIVADFKCVDIVGVMRWYQYWNANVLCARSEVYNEYYITYLVSDKLGLSTQLFVFERFRCYNNSKCLNTTTTHIGLKTVKGYILFHRYTWSLVIEASRFDETLGENIGLLYAQFRCGSSSSPDARGYEAARLEASVARGWGAEHMAGVFRVLKDLGRAGSH